MSVLCELQLNQPRAGIKVGKDISTEKWLIVKLTQTPLTNYLTNPVLSIEWFGQGYSAWGTYSIESNYVTLGRANGFTIGSPAGAPGSPNSKIWRYNVMEKELHFQSISMEVGGGLDYGESQLTVKHELVLYKAFPLGNKIVPLGGLDYADGFVYVKSWIKPFEERSIFWREA